MVQGSGLGIKEEIAAPMRASRTDDLAAALIRAGPPGTMVVPTGSGRRESVALRARQAAEILCRGERWN